MSTSIHELDVPDSDDDNDVDIINNSSASVHTHASALSGVAFVCCDGGGIKVQKSQHANSNGKHVDDAASNSASSTASSSLSPSSALSSSTVPNLLNLDSDMSYALSATLYSIDHVSACHICSMMMTCLHCVAVFVYRTARFINTRTRVTVMRTMHHHH